MANDVISYPSPNCGSRRGMAVDMLIIHYTGMWESEDALVRLCDPDAKVSAHYLIGLDGTTHGLVSEDLRAWHAGVSFWAGDTDVNSRSIGIELVNKGHDLGYHDFPEDQMAALIPLAQGIVARHRISGARVLGHSDVAPTRKVDPGEKFDWSRLAAAGVGLYPPEGLPKSAEKPDRRRFLEKLGRFGYATGTGDEAAASAAIEAFRRHYHPRSLGRPLDSDDDARLNWLLAHLPAAA